MKKYHAYVGMVLATCLFFGIWGCSSSGTDPDNNTDPVQTQSDWEMVGSWTGVYFEFANPNDSSQVVNLSQYGVSYLMAIADDSSYTSATTFLGDTEVETGRITVQGNQITIAPDTGDPRSGTYTLNENTLRIVVPDQEFDFTQDGIPEPATLTVELVKTD